MFIILNEEEEEEEKTEMKRFFIKISKKSSIAQAAIAQLVSKWGGMFFFVQDEDELEVLFGQKTMKFALLRQKMDEFCCFFKFQSVCFSHHFYCSYKNNTKSSNGLQ